jgi:peptidyl-dipeptidase Dcp
VEFPSQFNEHWATYPAVFANFARHYKTGEPMPAVLAAKIKMARTFNQGYALVEFLAAAELDLQWHLLPASASRQNPGSFEQEALKRTHLDVSYVPPRYRSSYFLHIWDNGYEAGYYAYMWAEMLDDDAFQWFDDHGGISRENGDRFRRMVLSRGNTEDLEKMYAAWRGGEPSVEPLLKFRGLKQKTSPK